MNQFSWEEEQSDYSVLVMYTFLQQEVNSTEISAFSHLIILRVISKNVKVHKYVKQIWVSLICGFHL